MTPLSKEERAGLVADLRYKAEEHSPYAGYALHAADEIEALAAEVERLQASRETLIAEANETEREEHRLRVALAFYANPEIYKPHPHGPAFDDRDLSFRARSALGGRHDGG